MNAVTATPSPPDKRETQTSMRSPLIASLLFHVFMLLLFSGAFFFFSKPIEVPDEPMSVEILPVADKAQSNIAAPVAKQMPKVPEEVKDEPPPMAKSTTQATPTKPEPPKPAEKVKADKMEEVKPTKAEPLKKAEIAEKKADPKPAPKAPEKKPQVAKKEETKEKPAEEDAEQFSSVLKNLVGSETPSPETRPVDTARQAPQLTAPAPLGAQMSMSEMDALRQQLAGCWNVIAGASDAQNLAVDVQVTVNADKTVAAARVVDMGRYGSDSLFRAAADSALRALRAPACTPLALPEGKYEQWKSMTINFDPKTMFGA